eukprot:scaffold908_cov333-Prasinococcus_capsulatus_cf.AAC.10
MSWHAGVGCVRGFAAPAAASNSTGCAQPQRCTRCCCMRYGILHMVATTHTSLAPPSEPCASACKAGNPAPNPAGCARRLCVHDNVKVTSVASPQWYAEHRTSVRAATLAVPEKHEQASEGDIDIYLKRAAHPLISVLVQLAIHHILVLVHQGRACLALTVSSSH